jgi:hypothetical protein
MKIMKIPSTKNQIPGPDRVNAYIIYYRYPKLETDDALLETDDALNLSSRARACSNKSQ